MKRRQGIAILTAGVLLALALIAVFAIELSNNQSQSRRRLETQAHQRAVLVSGLIDALFQTVARPNAATTAAYGAPHVSDATLQHARAANLYLALVSPQGRVIAHSDGVTGAQLRRIAAEPAVAAVRSGQTYALGNVISSGGQRAIDLVTPVSTPAGRRVLVSGVRLSAMSAFVAGELARVPGPKQQFLTMIDADRTIVATTNPAHAPGYRLHTPAQLKALSEPSGIVNSPQLGHRYFDRVHVGATGWQLFVSAPASEFFAPVSGFRHYLPWAIFVAFGLVAIAALLLVERSLKSADRIRVANDRLTASNNQLSSARLSLERSNDELERQAQELVRSNSELDQFASIASHDLQEPLRKVRTFTERISDTEAGNLSERGRDYLRRANSSAERMQVLIEDLLRYSRVTSQARPFASVDLQTVTADVLDDLSEQVARSDAHVEVSPLPTIMADPPQMRQLIQNLISNALKFRREDVSPLVRVDGEVSGGWLTLTVADNGIGFDDQYAQRIFRIFERLHGRGTYPGTGIGLALCRKIAERHGGTIVASSTPGEGATFTVTMQTERTEAVSAVADSVESSESAPNKEPYVAA